MNKLTTRFVPAALLSMVFAMALAPVTHAHEEPFGFLQSAQVEPKGELEITQWTTARIGKESGRYLGLDLATELEYGITERLQGSLYLTGNYHLLEGAAGGRDVFDDRNHFGISGATGELKYQLADPFRQPWGFAFYIEPGYATIDKITGERFQELEVELRLIAQKNFFDHRLITVFNYVIEPEWEHEDDDWEAELAMEWMAGASWKLSERWRVGVETRLHAQFKDDDVNDAEFLAFHAGPVVLYATEKWFASLTVLPQVAGWPDSRGKGGLHLDEQERVEIRLKFGTEF